MLIGGDDISNDVTSLGMCFSMFVYVHTCSTLRWLVEIWQLSWKGATGELEVEFKFQRRSSKLSFLFPSHCTSESLLTGYIQKQINYIL